MNYKKIKLSILILIMGIITIISIPNSLKLGTGDFRPYWSASYLIAQGQDLNDISLMDGIERSLTGWNRSFTMMAWFATTGMVILLPFTFLPFEKAAYYWLLTDILVLSATTFLMWKNVKGRIWIPIIVVFGFPMTLLSLYFGQVNTLVLLGIVLFFFIEKT